jgi:hypothetical protein
MFCMNIEINIFNHKDLSHEINHIGPYSFDKNWFLRFKLAELGTKSVEALKR